MPPLFWPLFTALVVIALLVIALVWALERRDRRRAAPVRYVSLLPGDIDTPAATRRGSRNPSAAPRA